MCYKIDFCGVYSSSDIMSNYMPDNDMWILMVSSGGCRDSTIYIVHQIYLVSTRGNAAAAGMRRPKMKNTQYVHNS